MAKPVGSIRVNVQPGLEKFKETLRTKLEKIERTHKLYIEVLPDVNRQRFKQALKEVEALLGTVEANVDAVLDKESVKQTKARIKEEFGSEEAMIKALLDPARAKATEARIKAIFGSENMYIRPILDRVAAMRTRSQLDLAFATKDVRLQTVANKRALQSSKALIERELRGETIFRNVGVMWLPGTFDGLRNTFFKYFPMLKPWVWPQLNMPQLKKTGLDAVKAWQNYVVPAFKDVRTVVRTHVDSGSLSRARGQFAMFKDITATVHTHLSKNSAYRAAAEANAAFGKSVEATVKPVFDRVAATKIGVQIKAWAAKQKSEVKVKTTKSRKSFLTAGLAIKAWAKRQRPKVQVHIDTAKAIAKASAELYAFYKMVGLRRFRRIMLQIGLTGTKETLVAMKNMVMSTMKLTTVFSVLSSMTTAFLSSVSLLKQSLAAMVPALGAVAGVAVSFGAGMAVAGVALKDFKNQLPGVVAQTKALEKQIVKTFWATSKQTIEKGLSAALRQVKKDLDSVSEAVGKTVGGLASGLGKSTGEIHTIMGNVTAGFNILAECAERAMRSLMRMLSAGSTFFPKFASWINDLTVRWEEWINKTENTSGGLVGWMQSGIDAAKLLGSTIGNLFGLFFDVAAIAASAGDGIHGFNERLKAARETIAEPVVQDGLFKFFEGAHDGMYALTDGITHVLSKFAEFGDMFGQIFIGIGELISNAVKGLADAIAQPVMLEGISTLVSGFNAVTVALQPVLQHLGVALGGVLEKIGELLKTNAKPLGTFVDQLGQFALITFDQLADLAAAILPGLLRVVNALMPTINDVLISVFPKLIGLVEQIMPALEQLAMSLLPPLIDIILTLSEPLGDLIAAVLPVLIDFLQAIIPPLMSFIQAILPALLSLIEAMVPVFNMIINILGVVLPPILNVLSALISAIVPIVTAVIDVFTAIATVTVDVWVGIKDTVSNAINSVSETISRVMGAIRTAWDTAWGAIKNAAAVVWEKIKAIPTGLKEAMARAVSGVKDVLVRPFQLAKDAISRIFDGIKSAARKVTDFAGKLNPFSGTFMKFAEGGVVSGPTLGLIGEKPAASGGYVPEAVVPLPKLQPMMNMAMSAAVRGHFPVGGVQTGYVVENLNVSLTGADVRDVHSIAEFVNMLNVESRMRAGV